LGPEYGGDREIIGRCAIMQDPILAFPAHWAPNGIHFYNGEQFPPKYRRGAFVAFHGGFNRAPLPNEGFNVVFVPFAGDRPAGGWEVFADGFVGNSTNLPAEADSSLMRLKELAIDSLKIDRFFIKDVTEDARAASIVKAIVAMANSLGISVVAEGVETIEQLNFLRTMHWDLESRPLCEKAQGFLFSQPLPADAATTLLRSDGEPKFKLAPTGT
jgi:hypothetical protein